MAEFKCACENLGKKNLHMVFMKTIKTPPEIGVLLDA